MMIEKKKTDYNKRLFDGGLRGCLHSARFNFLSEHVRNRGFANVFELGCFDGKTINYLASPPAMYVGVDAGWEGGLDRAMALWPQYRFIRSIDPADEVLLSLPKFDLAICMETLEHVKPNTLEAYCDLLARVTAGMLIVTVPVEFGPAFLGKYIAKRLWRRLSEGDGDINSYTAKEVIFASFGLTSKVRRGEHKGFDYRILHKLLSERFAVIRAEGHPFPSLPGWMNFGYGFVCVPKETTPTDIDPGSYS